MSHLFPFIVVVIVIVSKLLARAGNQSGGGNPPPRPRSSPHSAPPDSEEERMRRFMEAVGLPSGSSPPAPVRPRTAANPPPLLPVNPPAPGPITPGRLRRVPQAAHSPTALARTQPITRSTPPTSAPAPVIPQPAAAALIAQISAIPGTRPVPPVKPPTTTAPVKQAAIPASALLLRLRDPASIREAIILREVLGPPKALKALINWG